MTLRHRVVLLALTAVLECPTPSAHAGADFFRPGPVAPITLAEQGIFPQGRIMHIGGYSPGSTGVSALKGAVPLELAKAAGFTVAGPYYGPFDKSTATMERAAELGMHVAAQLEVPPALRFSRAEAKDALKLRPTRMTALQEEALRGWVRADMEQFLTNPILNRAVSCWAIAPEELRCWIKPELTYEQAFLKAVYDFDPAHRPAFMYEPNNRTTDRLLLTGPGQGFVLEGAYVRGYGWEVRRSVRINWALDQMTGAAAKDGRVVVPALELSQDIPRLSARDLASDSAARGRLRRLLRHDVYLALARGARGFQVWSLHHSRPKLTTYLELLNGYGEVFRELTARPLNLQEAILFGEHRDDVALEIVQGPATIGIAHGRGSGGTELEAVEGKIEVGGQSWPAVRLANIAYGPERLLILVNSAAQPVRARLKGIPAAARLSVLSGGDAAKLAQGDQAPDAVLEPFAALVVRVSGR
jgi:hypothetical protein